MAVPLPWYAKISAKIVLSRLPIPYSFWRGIGLFRNGAMDKADYSIQIFSQHVQNAFEHLNLSGKTVLELGSGDSVASAIIAASAGAEKIYLVDVGAFATRDMSFYVQLVQELTKRDGFTPPTITSDMSFEQMLEACNAEYLTDGLNSLKSIDTSSVDFIWSHSCLEHVRKHEFDATMSELWRILADNGQVSHSIDLQDHLEHSLNNLRFSENFWESKFMVRSGFYTNRLRASDYENSFAKSGFQVGKWNEGKWSDIPLPRQKMHKDFCERSERDLLVRTISTNLKKAA